MLKVYTAARRVKDVDALDVSRSDAGPDGIAFAPSMVLQFRLAGMIKTATAAGDANAAAVARVQFGERYLAEMRESYKRWRPYWDALLNRHRVVLVCGCRDRALCHRGVLGQIILPSFGAHFGDELTRSSIEFIPQPGVAR